MHGPTCIFWDSLTPFSLQDVVKQIACENGGLFHWIPDDGDLASAMANYYAVFASGLKSCDLRWVEYTDIVTGTDLLAGCLPIFEITSSDTTCGAGAGGDEGEDSAHLLGVTCMDINMIADLPTLRQHAEYPAFRQQMQASRRR